MPDIQEAKCFEFIVQIVPPPLGAPSKVSQKMFAPQDLFLYTPLIDIYLVVCVYRLVRGLVNI